MLKIVRRKIAHTFWAIGNFVNVRHKSPYIEGAEEVAFSGSLYFQAIDYKDCDELQEKVFDAIDGLMGERQWTYGGSTTVGWNEVESARKEVASAEKWLADALADEEEGD